MSPALTSTARSLQETVERRLFRTVLNLPAPVSRRLFGAPPTVDGLTLSQEIHAMLTLRRWARQPESQALALAQGRDNMVRQASYAGAGLPIGSVKSITVQGAEGPLQARRYLPRVPTAGALLIYFHGGGMVYGDLDSHDGVCRFLAEQAGVQVIAVDYRLAPEHPFPGGLRDCVAATRDIIERVEEFGVARERIAVGGDSAGGHFAAGTAIALARDGVELAFQLLIYPATDFAEQARSHQLFDRDYFLTREFMDACTDWYLAGQDLRNPEASVLYLDDVPEGLAPAYLATAGFDPLRDEGEAYGRLLRDAGVRVEIERFDSLIHGFFNIVAAGRDAVSANRTIAAKLKHALHA